MRNVYLFFLVLIVACKEESTPKPKAYLALSYPKPHYTQLSLQRPYTLDISENAVAKDLPKNWLKITYPSLKASVDITYRPVQNNLVELITEAEKLVLKHTVKADKISNRNFVNPTKKVYGTLNEIVGDAASQIQFHLTDSSQHFVKGALYFKVKPNYDSILPAVAYIKKDILQLIESLEWID